MARRRSTALARRAPARRRSGPSPAFLKAKKSASLASKRASALRRQYASPAGAMRTAAVGVAGAAAGGAANAFFSDMSVMGADADAVLALVLVGVGISSKKAWPIHAAGGIAATYAAEWGQSFAEGVMSGEPILEAVGMGGN